MLQGKVQAVLREEQNEGTGENSALSCGVWDRLSEK